ncbi:S8 family serine peptidase [Pseudenhygromyxa sp. WMMC2535]|uniref:S8 family serine peptidase n=1 Tax=Pseudenhygromyxa sp. WMMC2535 TaxID=2712867 RepID=UPI001557436E|nr:S8 family serine peptidase [Pseudenhygromyxa sp. WMMC2535]
MQIPWHLRWLDLDDGPLADAHGAGVTVALLDSGAAALPALPESGIRRLSYAGEAADARDSSLDGHGTSVAGIVASRDVNIPGVAIEAEVLAFDVYGVDGRPTDYRVVAALTKALELGVDLICCTFTLPELDDDLREVLAALRAAEVPVIVAAGNRGRQRSAFPEDVGEGLITVAALDPKDRVLANSRYGEWTTIAVPGLQILTWTSSGRPQRNFTGTSAAAPLLTAVLARVLTKVRERGGEAGVRAVKARLVDLLVSTAQSRRSPVPILGTAAFVEACIALADKLHGAPV